MVITCAGYGVWNNCINVTGQIRDAYAKGERVFLANNEWGGDPSFGDRKYLFIFWHPKGSPDDVQSGVVGENDSKGIVIS